MPVREPDVESALTEVEVGGDQQERVNDAPWEESKMENTNHFL